MWLASAALLVEVVQLLIRAFIQQSNTIVQIHPARSHDIKKSCEECQHGIIGVYTAITIVTNTVFLLTVVVTGVGAHQMGASFKMTGSIKRSSQTQIRPH